MNNCNRGSLAHAAGQVKKNTRGEALIASNGATNCLEKCSSSTNARIEIVFEGAVAYPLGEVGPGRNLGLKQMMDQVDMSRISHGVRAAAMMRHCVNEALAVARKRRAFGELIIDKPLLRRQIMKIMIPTGQALSMAMFTAHQLELADAGDA